MAATELHSRRRWKTMGGQTRQVYLEYLAVRSDRQGEGFGRQLEKQMVAHWVRRGYRGAYLLVEPHKIKALNFWEKQGWQRAPEADQPASRVLMIKQTV